MFTVRDAGPGDTADMALSQVEGWRTAYRGLIPQDQLDALDLTRRAQRWAEIMTAGRATCLVVEQKLPGTASPPAVGFVALGRAEAEPPDGAEAEHPDLAADDEPRLEGEIQALYVRPSAWGTGAGRTLLREAERRLLAQGYVRARLSVLAGNARARRFYRKAGWRTDDRAREHEVFQSGMTRPVTVRAVRYTKPLGIHEAWPPVRAELHAVVPGDLELRSLGDGDGRELRASLDVGGVEALFVQVAPESCLAERVASLADQVQGWVIGERFAGPRDTVWPGCPEHPRHPLRASVVAGTAVWACPASDAVAREIGRRPGQGRI
jgi:ribosomal protein S18 acetylase RimI-like enzyme